MCQIFTKARGPFNEIQLKRFYEIYLKYLSLEADKKCVSELIRRSCKLFTSTNTLNGVVLQKPLLEKFLSHYDNLKPEYLPKSNEVKFRNACSKICGSILCSKLATKTTFEEVYKQDKNIIEMLNEILILSLQKDKEAFESKKISPTVQKKGMKSLLRSSWNLMIFSLLTDKISSFITKINESWLDKAVPSLVYHFVFIDI